jgi:hypothetical protein
MTATDVDLDLLLDRLLARAAQRQRAPLVNAAGEEISPLAPAGRVTVAPNELIQSAWGNLVFDQSTNQFLSVADRDTQWPAPPDGVVCYTAAEATWWARLAGVWVDTGIGVRAGCRYYTTTYTSSATPNTPTIIHYTNKVFDQANAYNTNTGLYTCPRAGLYLVLCKASVNLGAAGNFQGMVYKNGVDDAMELRPVTPSGFSQPEVVDLVTCAAGDTLAGWGQCSIASTGMRGNAWENFFAVNYLGPP